ncbi:hypothetical protein HKBW3S44_01001, partial [Candidatus Hakubella thermalkaliphila]
KAEKLETDCYVTSRKGEEEVKQERGRGREKEEAKAVTTIANGKKLFT